MKVKELIEKLQQCNPEDVVILSKDEEGNGFYVLDKVEDVYDGEDGQKAVVLWP